jgi:hypothetical protein
MRVEITELIFELVKALYQVIQILSVGIELIFFFSLSFLRDFLFLLVSDRTLDAHPLFFEINDLFLLLQYVADLIKF